MAIQRIPFSGSTDGRGVLVAATSSPGTTIHTAQAGATDNHVDEIYAWVYNGHSGSVVVTGQFGGTTSPNDDIKNTFTNAAGLSLFVNGLQLRNGLIFKVYAATTNVIVIYGYVIRKS